MKNIRTIAIIGIGPRGAYALENFVIGLAKRSALENIHILLFEAETSIGSGPVYAPQQTPDNWINIAERVLLLDEREAINASDCNIPAFPSYHEWAGFDSNNTAADKPDSFPPRAKVGKYLHERVQSLLSGLPASLQHERVTKVEVHDSNTITVHTSQNSYSDINEVLLTIGHQPTELSDELKNWANHAAQHSNIGLFTYPYPIKTLLDCAQLGPDSTIAIRGFGLAMIDVVRAVANHYGEFNIVNESTRECSYTAQPETNIHFIPFSLDGLPPVPKPLNAKLDNLYKPSDTQLDKFKSHIGDSVRQSQAKGPQFLIDAFAPIAAQIYLLLPTAQEQNKLTPETTTQLVKQWLQDFEFKHPAIEARDLAAPVALRRFRDMATGYRTVSLDFCIGQVWRHCQPTMYEALSFNECQDAVIAEIISLDEGMKRYAYGPPVEAIQQLLALHDDGRLNLEFVNNPDIDLTPGGWCFNNEKAEGDKSIRTDIMINSVLNPPKIASVTAPLVTNMLADNLLNIVHDDLGITTKKNACIVTKTQDKDDTATVPIALLGRLAKGTVIGVDAILECFGERPQLWAEDAVKRHIRYVGGNN